jgi:hypothetical protein
MTPQPIGFGLVAAGVAGFFAGLFGLVGELSIYAAALGLALLVSGLVVLVITLRKTPLQQPHVSVIAVVVLGVALHAYESFGLAENGPSLGFFLWGIVPYLLCLVVAMSSKSAVPAFAGAVVALLFDLLAHYQVFVHPTSSTAGLALLFTPLWNTLVFSPLAILLFWLIRRRRARVNASLT